VKGAVNAAGKLSAWQHHFISFANDGEAVAGGKMSEQVFPGELLANYQLTQTDLQWDSPCGPWRAPGSNVFGFVVQGFLDEMAVAAHRDPVEFLLEVLGEPRWMVPGDYWRLNTGRASAVVKLAAEKSGWGKPMPKGRGLGIAFYFSHAGYFAEVADVGVTAEKKITVHRVTVVGDVGPIVNRSMAENQCEGSVIDGLSTMLGLKVTFEDGRAQQQNFDQYPMLRMPNTPEVDVFFIESDNTPSGLGEPALPPLAAAVCNAIYAASGQRPRTMPISEEGYSI
jgi:isoquinoline 1-oxidoreductase subunit beta